jgi:hypothetical protein
MLFTPARDNKLKLKKIYFEFFLQIYQGVPLIIFWENFEFDVKIVVFGE